MYLSFRFNMHAKKQQLNAKKDKVKRSDGDSRLFTNERTEWRMKKQTSKQAKADGNYLAAK